MEIIPIVNIYLSNFFKQPSFSTTFEMTAHGHFERSRESVKGIGLDYFETLIGIRAGLWI